jgi:hypothetical protein
MDWAAILEPSLPVAELILRGTLIFLGVFPREVGYAAGGCLTFE